MEFNWRSPLVTRLAILTATIFTLAFVALSADQSFLLIVGLAGAIIFQIAKLVNILDESNEDMAAFLDSIQFDDLTTSFKTDSTDPAVIRLHRKLNEALARLRRLRQERDSDYLFFKNIVQFVGIGILTFKRDGSIQIINAAAKQLLRITNADRIDDLRELSDPLVESFLSLKTGGRDLVVLRSGDDTIQLSVFAIELTLRGEVLKLISMSNIQSELEEKEMEAWQNLVRVLTHEIMNSVTPISSLAGVMDDELTTRTKEENVTFQKEEIDDMHLSLQTITRRSEGLIRFVKDFRNLTQIPTPQFTAIQVKSLLDELSVLYKKEFRDNQIKIEALVEPHDLTVMADKVMIEQVMINLLKNAMQAFDGQANKTIIMKGFMGEDGRPAISVKDNGPGIEEEALQRIFVPFFSTKKGGSGIGLSLSRQIMRKHEGRLTVRSKLEEGTEFVLRF